MYFTLVIIYSNSQTKRNTDEVATIRNINACFYTSLHNGRGDSPGRREHADKSRAGAFDYVRRVNQAEPSTSEVTRGLTEAKLRITPYRRRSPRHGRPRRGLRHVVEGTPCLNSRKAS